MKQDYLNPNDTPENHVENPYFEGIPYHEDVHPQDLFHPSYLPMFYDYRHLERHLEGSSESQWEWPEWNERQVLVKVEADLEAVATGSSFSEEGRCKEGVC